MLPASKLHNLKDLTDYRYLTRVGKRNFAAQLQTCHVDAEVVIAAGGRLGLVRWAETLLLT